MATNHRSNDTDVDSALAGLAAHDTSRERADRIRTRALRTMSATTRATRPPAANGWRRLEPVAALATGAAYMVVAFRIAIALYG